MVERATPFRPAIVLFGAWLAAGACDDRTTEIRSMANLASAKSAATAPSARPTDVTRGLVSCDWSSPSSVCIEFVAKRPENEAAVLERTGCKSETTPKPCRREALAGSCRVSEEGLMVQGRPVEKKLRDARVVTYYYYADGSEPYTTASAREACSSREHGLWLE